MRGLGSDVRWRSVVVAVVRGGLPENWGSEDRGGVGCEARSGDRDAICLIDGATRMTMRVEQSAV